MLLNAGIVPAMAGLTLVYCSVNFADYKDMVAGTFGELPTEPYLFALFFIVAYVMSVVPITERVEVICEQQIEHAALRESMFTLASRFPEWQTPEGLPRVAKWSSIAKSVILEPADFAAYALLQNLLNRNSIRAKSCSAILVNKRRIGRCIGKDEIREGLQGFIQLVKPMKSMNSLEKKVIRAAFKEVYGVKEMTDQEKFNEGIDKILKANPQIVKAAMEQEKQEREAERKVKKEKA